MQKTRKFAGEYFSFVVPSLMSFLLAGIYCFVDAYFVGNNVGDRGIAAINIGFCAIAAMQAVGSALGMGAGVHYTIAKARNDNARADGCLSCSYILIVAFSTVLSVPFIVFPRKLLMVLGASPVIADIGAVYMRTMGFGTFFQVAGTALAPIVRNCGGKVAAMLSVVLGCLLNIVLDWLFIGVLGLGMAGAAQASVLSMVLSFVICAVWLLAKGRLRFSIERVRLATMFKRILATGLSPFGLTMVPNISIVFINRACLMYGGDDALGIYGCISYVVYIAYLIFQGIADGSQPMLSRFYGADDKSSLKRIRTLTWVSVFSVALLSIAFCLAVRNAIGPFMGSSGPSSIEIARILPIFLIAYPFVAFSHTKAGVLYSTGRNGRSYLVTYSEPLFVLVAVIIMPRFMGLDGVWWANTVGMMSTALFSACI